MLVMLIMLVTSWMLWPKCPLSPLESMIGWAESMLKPFTPLEVNDNVNSRVIAHIKVDVKVNILRLLLLWFEPLKYGRTSLLIRYQK